MDYKSINKNNWNKRTEIHFDSDFYDNKSFIEGRNSLNSIELDLLGDVSGKSILHLQCHFGQDTISLSRMGAKVTGVDLSDKAIEKANELSSKVGTDTRFICSDVYELTKVLNEKFDIVFTSYGTIGWLPDINKWADVVAHFLAPEGAFVFAEFHPVVWMFDDDFKNIAYRYFNAEPIIEMDEGTYTDSKTELKEKSVSWNHGLAEVITALISKGIRVEKLQEFDYSPYNCFSNTVEVAPNKYRIKHLENKIPMVYALKGSKVCDRW